MTSIKNKELTDEKLFDIMKLEFLGSLYLKDNRIIIPGEILHRVFVEASKKETKKQKALIGVDAEDAILKYPGPTDPLKLWEDENYRYIRTVVVRKQRILRCRPIFKEWSADAVFHVNKESFNLEEFKRILEKAGREIGLLERRPQFGRFSVEYE